MSAQLNASPFYAVPSAGWMECPACGRLFYWGKLYARLSHGLYASSDPRSGETECPHCHTNYVLGLIAWPVVNRKQKGMQRGDDSILKIDQTPRDQLAQARHLAEARARPRGQWVKIPRVNMGDPANLIFKLSCNCSPLPWRADCPVHGHLRQGGGGESDSNGGDESL